MTSYEYTIPNAPVYGCALQIQNTGDIVNGIYSGAGVFVDDGVTRFPLITAGKDQLVDIPANSTIQIYEHYITPLLFRQNCRIVVDSTDIPTQCIMTPIFLLEMEQTED